MLRAGRTVSGVWTVLAVAWGSASMAATFYVAPDGSDRAAGTRAAPFQTLQRAADVAKPGDTVVARAGVYRETVTPRNSGLPGAPITFMAARGEKVVISGTEPIRGWRLDTGRVYRAPMSADFYRSRVNHADQVFVDGRMVNLARWPNTSLDISYPRKSTFTRFISKARDKQTNWTMGVFEDAALAPATDGFYVGAEIFVQPNKEAWSWAFSGTVVAQKGKQLTLKSRNDSGQDGNAAIYPVGSRYYLFNKRELLDAPGEWYHDRTTGTLYLMAPAGDDPAKHVVEARRRDFAFYLDGMSYITIQGFHLFACTITTDGLAGNGREWDENGNDLYPWRSTDSLPDSHHILLDGLDVRYPSHFTDVSGHFFQQWGSNSGVTIAGSYQTIQNCRVRYSAGNGIVTYGHNNRVLNNLIEDTAYSGVDCYLIGTTGGSGAYDCEIAYNTGRRTGRSGIGMRGLQNSDSSHLLTRVHHNDIGEFMLQDYDGGGTYTFGQDARFVRIDHNLFHDGPGSACSGIYTDYAKNWIIDHNVVWNVDWGIHLEGAHSTGVVNGLCYNNTLSARSLSFGLGNGVMPGLVMRNNLCDQPYADKIRAGLKDQAANLFWDRKPGSATDPRWVDAARGDYRIAAGSPARNAGSMVPSYHTEQPGSEQITVPAFADPSPDGKPDIGAYEYGMPAWKAGCSLKATARPPAAPRDLRATAVAENRVDLSWRNEASNASGFTVERKGPSGSYKRVALVSAASTEFYDTGLQRSTRYAYRVRAMNSAGASAYASPVQVVTPARTIADAHIGRSNTVGDEPAEEAWNAAPWHPIRTIADGRFDSDVDMAARWKALWDNRALYVRVEVADDQVTTDSAAPWYAVDGVELFIDGDNSKKGGYDDANDYQLGFVWSRPEVALGPHSARGTAGLTFGMARTPQGYTLTARLPWSMLLGYTPKPGALIGFDVHVNDSDDGKTLKGKRSWHAKRNESWLHPSAFGTVVLDPR